MAVGQDAEPGTNEASPLRPSSYILISSSTPRDDADPSSPSFAYPSRRRPRAFFLLPLLAALDAGISVFLGVLVIQQELRNHGSKHHGAAPGGLLISNLVTKDDPGPDRPDPHQASWERRKIVFAVMAFSVARACAYAIVGISKRIRELGATVAAISILSSLFYVSIANLLFQARSKERAGPDSPFGPLTDSVNWHWPYSFHHIEPTMPILISTEIAFTLVEWIVYIAVVGVKIPPGANPVKAKRWARSLRKDPSYQHGVEARSLYASDTEDTEDEGQAEAHRDVENAHARRDSSTHLLASPVTAGAGASANISSEASPARDTQGYGTMLQPDPRTPPSDRRSMADNRQNSVRSSRSLRQMSRSGSHRSELYSGSPSAAELGTRADTSQPDIDDSMESGELGADEVEEEEEEEESDPDDIIDITPNRDVARKEARMRLARAALPERRASGGTLSTLNLFGGGGGSQLYPTRSGEQQSENVFADEAGSPLARAERPRLEQQSLTPALGGGSSRHSSTSYIPSASNEYTPSTRSSTKERKFKLPKWMKPGKKKTGAGKSSSHGQYFAD